MRIKKQRRIGETYRRRCPLKSARLEAENKRSAFEIFCVAKKTPKGRDGLRMQPRVNLRFGERKRAVARNHKSCRRQAFGENKTRSVLPVGRPRLCGKLCRRQRAERSECRDICETNASSKQRGFCASKTKRASSIRNKPNSSEARMSVAKQRPRAKRVGEYKPKARIDAFEKRTRRARSGVSNGLRMQTRVNDARERLLRRVFKIKKRNKVPPYHKEIDSLPKETRLFNS